MVEQDIMEWAYELEEEDKTPSQDEIRAFAEKLCKEASEMNGDEMCGRIYYGMRSQPPELLLEYIFDGITERLHEEFSDWDMECTLPIKEKN
jgi:hypothetical protein